VRRGNAAAGVIAYFQSYSNTYVDPERFQQMLAALEPHLGDPVVCVSVATRPDTLPDWALARLGELARRVAVWVELGLEVADDRLLLEINRLHTVADFRSAVARVQAVGLDAIGHAILGLPGDGREGARRTASVLRETGVRGVKVHQMMVLEKTVLAHWWRAGRVTPLDLETYVVWLADFVEQLGGDQVLHRLTGDAADGELLAPRWKVHKNRIRYLLEAELALRGTEQGSCSAYPALGR